MCSQHEFYGKQLSESGITDGCNCLIVALKVVLKMSTDVCCGCFVNGGRMRKTARNGVTPFESHYCTSGYKFRDAVKQMKSLKDVGAQFLLCSILRDHPKCVEKLTEAGAVVNGVGMYPECNPVDTYDLDPVEMMDSTPLSLSVKFH